MKALVLKEYNNLVFEEMPTPEPSANEVLIEVKAVGICGSDVHGMDGSTGRRRPPIVMGHEAAGVIAAVGADVCGWSKGDRVTFDSTVYCGHCWFCRRGRINLCENRMVLGVSCDEYRRHGAFAQYVAVPQHILYRLPDGLPFERAAMVEALSIAVHAAKRTPRNPGDSALVVGTGMIGLLLVQTLRAAGYGHIIALDIDQDKLDLARKFGAAATIMSYAGNVLSEVGRLTEGRGVDHAFEVVGGTRTLQTALSSVRKGGTLTLVGNLSPAVELPLQSVVTREITLLGSCASCGEYGVCLDMLSRGQIDVDALISRVAPLQEGSQWFKRLYDKEPGLMKVILQP